MKKTAAKCDDHGDMPTSSRVSFRAGEGRLWPTAFLALSLCVATTLVPACCGTAESLSADPLQEAGRSYARRDYEETIRLCSLALARDGQCVDAWMLRASAKSRMEKNAAALSDFDEALKLDARNATAFAERGRLKALMLDLDGALEDCNRSVEIAPGEPLCWWTRSRVFAARMDFPRAIQDLDKAITLAPSVAGLWRDRGWLRSCLNDVYGARQDYDQAIKIDPGDDAVRAKRGELGTDRSLRPGEPVHGRPPPEVSFREKHEK